MIDHVQYYCGALKPWIARREQLGRFILRRDPRDISRIWALDPDGGAYLEVPYRTMSRPPVSAWEQQAAAGRLRELGRADIDESALFAMVEQMRQITDAAAATTRRARRDRERRAGTPPSSGTVTMPSRPTCWPGSFWPGRRRGWSIPRSVTTSMSVDPQLRVPPTAGEVEQLFAGWREELATCRKFATAARNYAAARLEADVGLRINEVRMLDLDDVRWELGRFGKLNVRHGKGSRRKGPKPRLVPLINGADRNLLWFIEDVWGQFGDDHERPGVPLFPSERKNRDGSCARATDDVFRRSLADAASRHLPAWAGRLTPHVLRHFCAFQLYLGGMNLFAIQELMGHAWTATTARYIHVHATHVEDAWVTGQRRVADRWKGLAQ